MKLTLLSIATLAAFATAQDEVSFDKPEVGGLKPDFPKHDLPKPGPPGPPGPPGHLIPGKPEVTKPFGDHPGKWTTSTVYSTTVKTIISCPPEKPACPATSTRVTTVIVPVSTTVCPVETTSSKKPYPPPPEVTKPAYPHPPPPSDKPKTLIPPVTAAPPPPPPPAKPPVHSAKPSYGTTGLPPKPSPTKPAVVTAGAAHVQRAGGALAAIAVAAALF